MKAIILDMYGVILKDSGEGFYAYVNQTFPSLSPADISPIWNMANVGEITSLEMFSLLGFTGNLQEIQHNYLDTVEINQDFYEFAQHIKKHYKLALLSNDSSEWSRYFRDKFDINQYFDAIIISGDVKIKKPNPKIFEMALEKLGIAAKDAVYVDDRRSNLSPPESLGIKTVLFNSRNVEYVGNSVKNFKELAKAIDYVTSLN